MMWLFKSNNLSAKLQELYEPEKNECLQRVSIEKLGAKMQIFGHGVEYYYLKDQLIAGVNSDLIKYELSKHSNESVKEFIETAKTVEMASEKAPGFALWANPSSSHQAAAEFHSVSTARARPQAEQLSMGIIGKQRIEERRSSSGRAT